LNLLLLKFSIPLLSTASPAADVDIHVGLSARKKKQGSNLAFKYVTYYSDLVISIKFNLCLAKLIVIPTPSWIASPLHPTKCISTASEDMCRISNQYVLHASDIDHSPQGQLLVLVMVLNGELKKYSIQHVLDPSKNIPTKVTSVRLLLSDNYICTGNECLIN